MGDVDDGRGGGGRRGGACACAEEGADDAVLCVCATEVVVEDGEQRGRVDRERCRAGSVAGVSGVGDGDDDLRVDIGAVLDEDRRRGRAQRHRRVQCSKATAELQSSLFFTHALRRDKRPFSPSSLLPRSQIPQERILKVVEFSRVRCPLHCAKHR